VEASERILSPGPANDILDETYLVRQANANPHLVPIHVSRTGVPRKKFPAIHQENFVTSIKTKEKLSVF